ncbi:MAG: hypothetical protein ACREL6_13270, partial [Gemmatimonadales bacterium]
GDPTRLTFNPGTDRGPRWLPDGTGIIYSLEHPGNDSDRCLGLLPPTGGQLLSVRCERSDGSDTTTDAWEWPAAGPGGAIAWMRTVSRIQEVSFRERWLRLDNGNGSRDVISFPYTSESGVMVGDARDIRWLTRDQLVYVAQSNFYAAACGGCPPDTLTTGVEIVLLALNGTPTPEIIPGTDLASSVAPGPTPGEIYFTLNNDQRVFHHVLSTGTTTVAHDFGGSGIARDIDVIGSRLIAVVGGPVTFSLDPVLGPVQRDGGGNLHLVELGSGTDLILGEAFRCWRHPSLSPDGTRVVAEGYSFSSVTGECDGTAFAGTSADLWLLETP